MMILWIVLLSIAAPVQHQPAATNDRAAMVMGFDQEKTAHHFYLYNDGGAIDVTVKDANDTKDRDAIRSHLPHIAMMFSRGDFNAPMLVHDTEDVPGTAVLAARKDTIAYRYVDTPTGGRVNIVTTDAETLTALHVFLRYQIREHHTGDPGTVDRRK